MPYAIRKRGSKFVVVNKETGSVKGEHRTKTKALAQLRALYANVPEAHVESRGGKKRKR